MSEYELLDEFLFGLPQDDFNAKWVCIGWPHKIEIQMEQTYRLVSSTEFWLITNYVDTWMDGPVVQ